jgi:hypothetical protein
MLVRLIFSLVLLAVVAACGDKVPESEEAKKIGNIPKQTIDRAQANLDAAMKAGVERDKKADEKEDQR